MLDSPFFQPPPQTRVRRLRTRRLCRFPSAFSAYTTRPHSLLSSKIFNFHRTPSFHLLAPSRKNDTSRASSSRQRHPSLKHPPRPLRRTLIPLADALVKPLPPSPFPLPSPLLPLPDTLEPALLRLHKEIANDGSAGVVPRCEVDLAGGRGGGEEGIEA